MSDQIRMDQARAGKTGSEFDAKERKKNKKKKEGIKKNKKPTEKENIKLRAEQNRPG